MLCRRGRGRKVRTAKWYTYPNETREARHEETHDEMPGRGHAGGDRRPLEGADPLPALSGGKAVLRAVAGGARHHAEGADPAAPRDGAGRHRGADGLPPGP